MAYAALTTIQALTTGSVLTAATLVQANDNFEFLVDPPSCSVYNNAVQSVADTTVVALTANSEYHDNNAMHSTSVNTSRITCQTAGRYELNATAKYASDVDGIRRGVFRLNGATDYESMQVPAVSAVRSCIITCTRKITLAAGDYVEFMAEHTAGAALDVTLLEFAAKWETR